jgi:hypothetical protein
VDELNKIKIIKYLILNLFWKEMTEDVILEIVGIWKRLFFLHKVRLKELLELGKQSNISNFY